MNLQICQARLIGATKGHKLLKKKRDALKSKFQSLMRTIIKAKVEAGQALKDCAITHAKAHWAVAGDDFTASVIESAKRPSLTIKLTSEAVAGVMIPNFKLLHDPTKDAAAGTIGVASGGAVIQANRKIHHQAVRILVNLASLQTSFVALDEEIKMTSRRVNALEYVLIPKMENIISVMIQEMDEEAREDFYRVKKVVQNKRDKVAREMQAEAREESALDAPSLIVTEKDEDLIF